jgi:hypothetical protein
LLSLYWLLSPRFRKQWRDYRKGGTPPGWSAVPKSIRVSRKQFDAWVAGAMAAMRELPDISRDAKARLQQADAPIV